MANVKLRIEVNPNAEGESIDEIQNYSGSTATNSNISNTSVQADSNGVFDSIQDIEMYGSNGLSFGDYDLVFTEDDCLGNFNDYTFAIVEDEEAPNEFIWGSVPSSGEYRVKLTFTSETSLERIYVFGDESSRQFPTEAVVDGTVIYNDDYKWAIDLGDEATTHTIEFTKWNRPNYNACLTGIKVMMQYYDVEKYNGLISLESTSESTPNAGEINYGVFSNSGSAQIVDADGEIEDLIEEEIVPSSNVPMEIYLNENKIQSHISIDSDYNIVDKTFNVSLENKLNYLDKIKYNGYVYPEDSRTLYDITDDVFSRLGYIKENVADWNKYYKRDSIFVSSVGDRYTINVDTVSGWEIIGIPIKVKPGTTNTLSFVYSNAYSYTSYDGNGGIPCQILNSYPTQNSCSSISISTTRLSNNVVNNQQVSISFTPNTEDAFLIFNFGYANDSQSIALTVGDFLLNGKSTHSILQNEIIGSSNETITVADYMKSIKIRYPYIQYGHTLREVFDYICQVSQLQMILTDVGEYKFVSARPMVSLDANKAIKIPKYLTTSNLQYDIMKKNKYDGVELSENLAKVETNTGSLVYTEVFDDFDEYYDFFDYELNISDIQHSNGISTEQPFGYYEGDPITCGWWSDKNKKSYAYAYSLIKDYYKKITFTIPYIDENGLDRIKDITEGMYREESPNYTVYYNKGVGLAFYNGATSPKEYSDDLIGGVSGEVHNGITKSLKTEATFTGGQTPITITATAEQGQDASYLTVTRDNDNQQFIVECQFIAAQKFVQLSKTRESASSADFDDEAIYGTAELHSVDHIEISVYGTKKTLTFEEISASTSNIDSAKNPASLMSNNLIQTTTEINGTKISNIIKNNVLSDYSDGIKTATISVFCNDLYHVDGTIAKSFSLGQILDVGDIIVFDDVKTTDDLYVYWRIIGRTFRYDGDYKIDLSLQEVKGNIYYRIQDMSWASINSIAQSGKAEKLFSLGDTKTITLTSSGGAEDITFEIVGFNHDDIIGGGKAAITFGTKNLFANKIVMNATASNQGGWVYSILRIALNNTLNNSFPADLKQIIKTVGKNTLYSGAQSTQIVNSEEKLWAFSEVEVDGTTSDGYNREGEQYALWKQPGKTKRKSLANGSGAYSNWWLRSPNTSNSTTFIGFNASGYRNSFSADSEQGICCGFCI